MANFSIVAFTSSGRGGDRRHDDCERAVEQESPRPERGRDFWAERLQHDESEYNELERENPVLACPVSKITRCLRIRTGALCVMRCHPRDHAPTYNCGHAAEPELRSQVLRSTSCRGRARRAGAFHSPV